MKKHNPKFKIYGTRKKGRLKVFIIPFVLEPNRTPTQQWIDKHEKWVERLK